MPLSDLVARPDRATVLSARKRKALTDQIAHHGCYPALIVRPHPRRPNKYEVLDGHHRAQVLRALGAKTARCEVWPVEEADADVVAATLNRLRGRQDLKRRGRQARRLLRRYGVEGTAAKLGITPAALRQELTPDDRPRPSQHAPGLDLHAVVFHLSAEEADRLSRALANAHCAELGRAKALMKAISSPSLPPIDSEGQGSEGPPA